MITREELIEYRDELKASIEETERKIAALETLIGADPKPEAEAPADKAAEETPAQAESAEKIL